MKNSKFIFVPILATSMFIFLPMTANADARNSDSIIDENVAADTVISETNETNAYEDQSLDDPRKMSVTETAASQKEVYESEANTANQSTETSQENSPSETKSALPNDISNENQEDRMNDDKAEQPLNNHNVDEKINLSEKAEETDTSSVERSQQPTDGQEVKEIENNTEGATKEDISVEESDDKQVESSSIDTKGEKSSVPPTGKTKSITKKTENSIHNPVNNQKRESQPENIQEFAEDDSTENKEKQEPAANSDENPTTENDEQKSDKESGTSKDEVLKKEPDSKEKSNDNAIQEVQTLKNSSDNSIKFYSLNIKAKSVKPAVTNAQYAARFTNGNHSGLYSPVTSSKGVSLDFMDDKTVFITQKANFHGTIYYRVHKDLDGAMQGWVKEKDLRLFNISDSVKHVEDYAINKNDQYLLTNPWGTSEQRTNSLDKYNTKLFRVKEKLTLGSLTFYYGKIDDDYGWLQNTKLKKATPPKTTNVNYAAKLDTNKNSGLYSPMTSRQSHDLNFMKNKTIYITQKANYNDSIFYRVHSKFDGAMQGWINEKDLNLWKIYGPENHKKDYSIVEKNDYLLSDPYGTSNQTVKKLSSYGNSNFKAERKLKIGALTYYYGKINSDYGWIAESKIKSATPKISNARFAVRVVDGNNSGIYSPVTNKKGKKLGKLQDMTLYTTRMAEYDNSTYYRVHSDIDGAMQGWIKESDLSLWKIFGPDTHRKNYSIASKNKYLLETPYGTSLQRVSKLSNYGNTVFQAQKSIKIGQITFFYGKIGNDYGWLQENRLKDYSPVAPSPSPSVKTVKYNQSLNQVLNTQMDLTSKPQAWVSGGGWKNATRSEVSRFLDTSNHTSETWMYTFLDLNRSQNIESSTINSKLLNGKGTLNRQGRAFLNASKTYSINEVYLISHALHETGNGTSTLAKGVRLDSNGSISSNGKKYYNMYGIAAYDHNPVLAGARYAQQMGWDTPTKAIVGGAQFISQSYFNREQTTLYSMRWNPSNPGTYQYATDVNWAYATAQNLRNYYRQLGIRGQYYTKHIF